MSGVDVLVVFDKMREIVDWESQSLFSGLGSLADEEAPAARAAISELIEAAEGILSHNPAHFDTDEEARLRAALAAVRPTPTPKVPT